MVGFCLHNNSFQDSRKDFKTHDSSRDWWRWRQRRAGKSPIVFGTWSVCCTFCSVCQCPCLTELRINILNKQRIAQPPGYMGLVLCMTGKPIIWVWAVPAGKSLYVLCTKSFCSPRVKTFSSLLMGNRVCLAPRHRSLKQIKFPSLPWLFGFEQSWKQPSKQADKTPLELQPYL